jgi:hypothetical protein
MVLTPSSFAFFEFNFLDHPLNNIVLKALTKMATQYSLNYLFKS